MKRMMNGGSIGCFDQLIVKSTYQHKDGTMNLYLIECGYKSTNGKLCVDTEEFEGENPEEAMRIAKAFYAGKINYRSSSEMIFSTPFACTPGQKAGHGS
jgi:hypothetical protein